MTDSSIHEDFRSSAWCMKLIDDPAYSPIPWPTRPLSRPPDHPCSLFAETLNSTSTVRGAFALWLEPSPGSSALGGTEPGKDNSAPDDLPDPAVGQAVFLVSLGNGMNYHHNTLHGGIISALMDEAMGLCAFQERGWATGVGMGFYTAEIKIQLLQRVRTPGIVLVRTWRDEGEARKAGVKWHDMKYKFWILGQIESGDGKVLARAKYLFVQRRSGTAQSL
jgi:acyl-coenzyme A thioesterase PaaI-like protein